MDEPAVEVTVEQPAVEEQPEASVAVTEAAEAEAQADAAAAAAATAALAAEAALATAHTSAALAEAEAASVIHENEQTQIELEGRVSQCEAQLTEALNLLNTVVTQQTAILATQEQLMASLSPTPPSSEEVSQAEVMTDPAESVVVESPAVPTRRRRLL